MQGSDALPVQRVSSANGLTSTTGRSTKLERMTRRIGRREELLSSAKSIINPLSNEDNAIITTDLNPALIFISIFVSLKGWQNAKHP